MFIDKSVSLKFLLKTMERLIDRYIRIQVLVKYPLYGNQHAYQRGKSTISTLHRLSHSIESALDEGEHVLAVFLYVEGARQPLNLSELRRQNMELMTLSVNA
jgi:hypothetical protein